MTACVSGYRGENLGVVRRVVSRGVEAGRRAEACRISEAIEDGPELVRTTVAGAFKGDSFQVSGAGGWEISCKFRAVTCSLALIAARMDAAPS